MKYLVLYLLCFSVFAAIVDDRQYSEKYFAGKYLIYDCKDQHWVCSDREANKKCLDKRKMDIIKKKPLLSCIPVKRYKNLLNCIKKKQYMVNNPVDNLLCQHPDRLSKPFISL